MLQIQPCPDRAACRSDQILGFFYLMIHPIKFFLCAQPIA